MPAPTYVCFFLVEISPLSGRRWTAELDYCGRSSFLSVAQPTDQGEESVVLLFVAGAGTIFSSSHAQFFGVLKGKTLSQKGCERQKLCLKRGVKRQKPLSQKGCEKAKTFSKGV